MVFPVALSFGFVVFITAHQMGNCLTVFNTKQLWQMLEGWILNTWLSVLFSSGRGCRRLSGREDVVKRVGVQGPGHVEGPVHTLGVF